SGFSGPYRRKSTSNPASGLVGIRFDALPAGALGPKYTSTDPSAFFCSPGVNEDRLDHCIFRMSACVARSYAVADQYKVTGAFAGTLRRYVFLPSRGSPSLSLMVIK